MSNKPIIKVKNLNVVYFPGKANEIKALKNIDLEIFPGEFIIFFGPSGCGKSTLLYAISGLEKRAQGSILIDGMDINKLNAKQLETMHQKKIGMIFQAYYLIGSLSVLKNVLLPQMAIGANRFKRKKRAMELLERFGVKEQAHKLPNNLSGGQQQRVAICRSVVNDPDVIFADEPVGNLDSKSSDEVMRLLEDLNDRQKKTIILVTHNPEHLSHAHRVFHIKDGTLMKIDVNKAINREVMKPEKQKVEEGTCILSKELELLARTFSGVKDVGTLMVPFKVKQIVLEILTGFSADEIKGIREKVEALFLSSDYEQDETVERYLDESSKEGGLDMDSRTAKRLSREIGDIIQIIRKLEKIEEETEDKNKIDFDLEIVKIRRYIFNFFDIETIDAFIIKRLDVAIKKRLKNEIDKEELEKILDRSIRKGGVGFDTRISRKIARRLELLILGKFK